jgi:hypothetical protein
MIIHKSAEILSNIYIILHKIIQQNKLILLTQAVWNNGAQDLP